MKLEEHIRISRRAVRDCFRLERRFTVSLMASAALEAGVVYIPLYFSAKVIDALYRRAAVDVITVYVLLTVGLVFLVRLLITWLNSVKNVAMEAWYRNEEWKYSEKAMEMAYASVEDPELTRLLYRIRKESQTGYNRFYLHRVIERFCSNLVKIVASLSMTISFFALPGIPFGWKLAMGAGVALTIAVSGLSSVKINRLYERFGAACVDMNVMTEQFLKYMENYGAGKDIRLYGMGDYLVGERRKCSKSFRHQLGIYNRGAALWTIPVPIVEKGFQLGLYAVLIYGALEGGVSVGAIAKYAACLMLLVRAGVEMVTTLLTAGENNKYLKRYFSWFDIQNDMYQGSLTVEKRDDNDYQVEFRNVSFCYPGADTPALSGVNLKFKIGEKLAIVGRNGSGKTTFIKLLCRLYDPDEGEILLNGVNIKKYDYDEYMLILSVVFQDFRLFSLKLGEVVACGRRFDTDRVRESLSKAGFEKRYEELTAGADTCLYRDYDKDGVEISGGEAQKIALARALYKDAPFILLDEPTAALDPVSEYEVYSNFNAISGDKTAVYISHRLASCRFCDQIAVFEKGRIVQRGTHEGLLQEDGGLYQELWQAQAKYYAG